MDTLKRLLYLLSNDKRLKDVWKEAGYRSLEDARAAMRAFAGMAIDRDDKNRIIINVDGASRGNPGPSAVAAVAFLQSGEAVGDSSRTVGEATNNIAEYKAVLEGLTLARRLGAVDVVMRLDSELVVKQLNGLYKIKNAKLRELAEQVRREAAALESCVFEHVPREENREADRLANKCLDGS